MPSADELRAVGECLADGGGYQLWRCPNGATDTAWIVTRTDSDGQVRSVSHFLFAESAIAWWAHWSGVVRSMLGTDPASVG